MSIKTQIFNYLPRPQTICHYLVNIPTQLQLSMLTEATTYPTQKYGEVAIPFAGQSLYRPTQRQLGGIWSCTISENQLLTVRRELLMAELKNLETVFLQDISVIPLTIGGIFPANGVVMHNAWIMGREPVDLSSSEPTGIWQWKVDFRYDYLSERIFDVPKAISLISSKLGL